MTARRLGGPVDDAAPTFASEFDTRSNSIAFLRYLLAALVVVDHAFPIGGFHGGSDPMWGWTRGQESFGGLAVAGFFVLSGYLITRSFTSSPNTFNFVWRRFLRIFPAFWVCLLITVLVFGPIAALHQDGTLAGYFSAASQSPLSYLRSNWLLTMHQYDINGLLRGSPYSRSGYPEAFDGSLWTLIYEFECYLGVALLGVGGLLRRGRGAVLALLGGMWLLLFADTVAPGSAVHVTPLFADKQLLRLPLLFAIGAAAYLYEDRIPMSRRTFALAGAITVFTLRFGCYSLVGWFALAYVLLWLVVHLPVRRFDRYGDFSYGLYIYAFPVEQMLADHRLEHLGLLPFIAISLVASTALAVVSWKVVEAPALRLKHLGSSWPAVRTGRPQPSPPAVAAVVVEAPGRPRHLARRPTVPVGGPQSGAVEPTQRASRS